MTTANPSLPAMTSTPRAIVRTLLGRLWAFNWLLTLSVLLYLVLVPIYLSAAIMDPRLIANSPAFVKPLKFILSSAIYLGTLLWLLTLVKGARRWIHIALNIIALGLLVENVLITMQAIRGTTSHFNLTTPFDSLVFSTMGLVIMVVAVLNLLIGIWLLFQRLPDPVIAWGVRLGLLISVVGMMVAFLMTSTPTQGQQAQIAAGQAPATFGAHSVDVEDGGPGLPFLGWSTEGGDLRVPHFIGLHGMQFLPLLAFALTRRSGDSSRQRLNQRQRLAILITLGLAYLAWIVLLTWQALRGQPVLAPDALTLSAYAGLISSVLLSLVITLSAFRQPVLSKLRTQ